MHETSKAVQRRLHDSNFVTRYFRGNGIDIGSGNDPLVRYMDLFPGMSSCVGFDRADGDAQDPMIEGEAFDFVHSSHCLEDLDNPEKALKEWFRILKPGGHLIVTVPDEDMYEQGVFPSTFNSDHKWTFTIHKVDSWSDKSINLVDLIKTLGPSAELVKIERLTATYFGGRLRMDQTRNSVTEAAIEFVVRKSETPQRKAWAFRPSTSVDPPKIALYRPGALGDIIMTLACVPLLKAKYPKHEITYFCHPDYGSKLIRLMIGAGVKAGLPVDTYEAKKKHEYDKFFNLIGYPLHEGYPEKPMKKHLIQYFADEMGLETNGTIPFLTLTPGENRIAQPYATIHPQAGWSHYKMWPKERWEEVIRARRDIRFYQIGSETDYKLEGADCSFMGRPLDESLDLMAHATLHLGVDTWTNHATNIHWQGIGFVPSIILFGSTQASASGYARNTNLSLRLPCQPCFREDPKISASPRGPCVNPPGQVYDDPHHACMGGIETGWVLTAIDRLWPAGRGSYGSGADHRGESSPMGEGDSTGD